MTAISPPDVLTLSPSETLDLSPAGNVKISNGTELVFVRATNPLTLEVRNQVSNPRTLSIPDLGGADGDVVVTNLQQTLTAKDINADVNQLTNIDNADIKSGAEIAVSKLADGAARQVLQTDAVGTGVEWTDSIDLPGTLGVAGAVQVDGGQIVFPATQAASPRMARSHRSLPTPLPLGSSRRSPAWERPDKPTPRRCFSQGRSWWSGAKTPGSCPRTRPQRCTTRPRIAGLQSGA